MRGWKRGEVLQAAEGFLVSFQPGASSVAPRGAPASSTPRGRSPCLVWMKVIFTLVGPKIGSYPLMACFHDRIFLCFIFLFFWRMKRIWFSNMWLFILSIYLLVYDIIAFKLRRFSEDRIENYYCFSACYQLWFAWGVDRLLRLKSLRTFTHSSRPDKSRVTLNQSLKRIVNELLQDIDPNSKW